MRGGLDDAYFAKLASDPNYRITRRKNPSSKDNYPPHLLEVPRQHLMLDIDGYPLSPEADLANMPEEAIKSCIADLLPAEFRNATCYWQLSSSCGIVPSLLKVHLFFWLNLPWDYMQLRRWFKQNAPHVDPAPFNAVQPHYICDPVIVGADDPLPVRTGWLYGTRDNVMLTPITDEPEANRSKRPQHNTGRAATSGLYAASIEDALSKLGDGEELEGFHAPLMAASMQYARRCAKGGTRDDDAFYAKLLAAIEAAPRREGRDVAGYLDQTYLVRITEGGFAFIKNTQTPDVLTFALPDGFGMTETGLYFTDPNRDEAKSGWVCAPFQVKGACSSDTGEQWGIVLGWEDDGGWPHTFIVDRATLHGEPSAIAAQLDNKGLRCSTIAKGQQSLRRCLASLRPERRLTAVERGGWFGDAYVLPNGEVIGGADVMMRSEIAKHDLASARNGTLGDWHRHIGGYCVGNSRLVLCMSASFAGPLLDIIHEPSGGLHLYGGSQKGKTTAGATSATPWGKGARGGKIQQWRATPNAIKSVAARSSDGFLVMDELSQSEATDAGAAAYMLANEQGKARMTRSAALREQLTWRLIFVSTGEVTLAQRMAESNKKPLTGMEVRLIDIPMDGGVGMGLFENTHGFASPGAFADHLRDMAATYYGTAARAFLEKLVAARSRDPEGVYDNVKRLREQFIADHLPAGSDGQVRSVCGRFGVIAAAGEMAIAWGVLNWPKGEAERGAVRCFQDWLKARGGTGAGEEQKALAQVRGFFEAHGSSRFADISSYHTPHGLMAGLRGDEPPPREELHDKRVNNRVGFRKMDQTTKKWMYYVMPRHGAM